MIKLFEYYIIIENMGTNPIALENY